MEPAKLHSRPCCNFSKSGNVIQCSLTYFSVYLTLSLLILCSFLSISASFFFFVSIQELERFKTFVKRKPAFDVVVDGLNVANIRKDKSKLSETVRKHT